MILSPPTGAHAGRRGLWGVGQPVTPSPCGCREHFPASGRDHVGDDGVPGVSVLHETQGRPGRCFPGRESPVRSLGPRGGLGGVGVSRPARPGRCRRNAGWDGSSRERQCASTLLEARTMVGHLSRCGLCRRTVALGPGGPRPRPVRAGPCGAWTAAGLRARPDSGILLAPHPQARSSEAPKSLGCDPLSPRSPQPRLAPTHSHLHALPTAPRPALPHKIHGTLLPPGSRL